MGIRKIEYQDYDFPGIYRGTVVYNVDPDVKGKLKIFVHGVYPDEYFSNHKLLPWAQPAMSLFGGNWTNQSPDEYGNHLNDQVGWCTVPHQGIAAATGSQVYVFFQNSDINKPVYFAAAQSGKGWFSEHPNQHVFRTDNIQIRIDEDTSHPASTCKFDSYNQRNNDLSIQDGTLKDVETRLDIQILAESINAVNLQISGNVNMKIIGDMYLEHEGDKHQTHIGNTYIKHIGDTYQEQQGEYVFQHTGNYTQKIQGDKILHVQGNTFKTVTQNQQKNIQQDYKTIIGANYDRMINGNRKYTIVGNNMSTIAQDCTITITGNTRLTLGRGVTTMVGNQNHNKTGGNGGDDKSEKAEIKVAHDLIFTSTKGNIEFRTLGEFELMDADGNITANGYNNIGTKGNIKLTSTLGNILLQTVNNDNLKPSLLEESYVIPWNPRFLSNVSMIAMIFPDFDPKKATTMNFSKLFSNMTSPTGILNFILQLPLTIIYDGLPSFFPVKMIVQNPNIAPINDLEWTTGGFLKFKSQQTDWRRITNKAFWKVLGRMIGNITIDAWSGDIDLRTHGKLGNAGNINIHAEDEVGALPKYKTGNVNIKNESKFRIYTDPRNLFLDSASIFNRTTILTSKALPQINIPTDIDKDIIPDIDELLKNITPTLDLSIDSPGSILGALTVVNTNPETTAGGCASCIADAFISVIKNKGLLYKDSQLFLANNIPLHKVNSIYPVSDLITDRKVTTDVDTICYMGISQDPNFNKTMLLKQIMILFNKYKSLNISNVYAIPKIIKDVKKDIRGLMSKFYFTKALKTQIMSDINTLVPDLQIDPSDLEAASKFASIIPDLIKKIPSLFFILLKYLKTLEKPYTDGSSLNLFNLPPETNGLGHAITLSTTTMDFKKGYGSINFQSVGSINLSAMNDFNLSADLYYQGDEYIRNVNVTPNWGYFGQEFLRDTEDMQITNLGNQIINIQRFGDTYEYSYTNNKIDYVIGVKILESSLSAFNTVDYMDDYELTIKHGGYEHIVKGKQNDFFGTQSFKEFDAFYDPKGNLIKQNNNNDNIVSLKMKNPMLPTYEDTITKEGTKYIINNLHNTIIADHDTPEILNNNILVTYNDQMVKPTINLIPFPNWPKFDRNLTIDSNISFKYQKYTFNSFLTDSFHDSKTKNYFTIINSTIPSDLNAGKFLAVGTRINTTMMDFDWYGFDNIVTTTGPVPSQIANISVGNPVAAFINESYSSTMHIKQIGARVTYMEKIDAMITIIISKITSWMTSMLNFIKG